MSPHDHIARQVRRDVVRMCSEARASHVASALSCVDILVALYFGVGSVDPGAPRMAGRDRIILSKGHAAPALYAVLAERGFFPREQLDSYCRAGSLLAEHPSLGSAPGVECTTGSLGHGLGIGVGMAYALTLAGNPSRVWVVVSDGECNEGSVWEAAMLAPRLGLGSLTVIVDFNGFQACGASREIMALEPLADKWRAFGWDVADVDGHDLGSLITALAPASPSRTPRAFIAHTVKGKGISFMENDLEWHYRPPSADDLACALEELREAPE